MAIAAYLELVSRVVGGMASFPPSVLVIDRMQEVARDFARDTLGLLEDFDLDLVSGERNYSLVPGIDASIHKVIRVFRRGPRDIVEGRDGHPLALSDYELHGGAFSSGGLLVGLSVAGDLEGGTYLENGEQLNDLPVYTSPSGSGYLFCGFSAGGTGIVYYLSDAAGYAAAQAGGIPANAYLLPPPYSVVAGLYRAQGDWLGTATVASNTLLSSGAKRLVLRNASSVSVEAGMRVRCAMLPDHYASGLPADFLNDYSDAIIAGTRAKILMIPKRPWSDRELSMREQRRFEKLICDAKWAIHDGNKVQPMRLTGEGGSFFL